MVVAYLKGYFNSSDEGRKQEWERRCANSETVRGKSCVVPESFGGQGGEGDAATVFLADGKEDGEKSAAVKGGFGGKGKFFLALPLTLALALSIVMGWDNT